MKFVQPLLQSSRADLKSVYMAINVKILTPHTSDAPHTVLHMKTQSKALRSH